MVPGCNSARLANCLVSKANQEVKMTDKKRAILYLFIIAFITNLIWENLQAPLYTSFKNFGQHFSFCLVASLVDAVVILGFYFAISLIRKNSMWLLKIRLADTLMLMALGLVTAIVFEKWALKSGTWDYTSDMPIIFGIGIAPLIQLAILSIISIYLLKITFGRRVARHN